MILTVIQPSYFPNISALSRMARADVVVWADSFRYSKHSTINRARIKTVSGAAWLTVPILTTGRISQPIQKVIFDKEHFWRQTHLRSLEVSYQNSPYYSFFSDDIENILNENYVFLNDILLASTRFLLRKLRTPVKLLRSVDLPKVEDRSRRVVRWMQECKCDEYLVESADMNYIDAEIVGHIGKLIEFEFCPKKYYQLFQSYIENLSGLDLLFNEGEMSKLILAESAKLKRT
jgi:hypothetical protein